MNIFDLLTLKSKTHYLRSDSTLRQALEKFDAHKFTAVPVLDPEGKYLFTLSEGDILRTLKNTCKFDMEQAERTSIADIPIYRDYKCLNIMDSIEDAYELSTDQNFIPVVDGRGIYIGFLERKNVINTLLKKAA